jgi:hypothetical protein
MEMQKKVLVVASMLALSFWPGITGMNQLPQARSEITEMLEDIDDAWKRAGSDEGLQSMVFQEFGERVEGLFAQVYEPLVVDWESQNQYAAWFCDYCLYRHKLAERPWYQSMLKYVSSLSDTEVGKIPELQLCLAGGICFRQTNYTLTDTVVAIFERWERTKKVRYPQFYRDALWLTLLPGTVSFTTMNKLVQGIVPYFIKKKLLPKVVEKGTATHSIVHLLLVVDEIWRSHEVPNNVQKQVIDALVKRVHKPFLKKAVLDNDLLSPLARVCWAQKQVINPQVLAALETIKKKLV